jgi:hypothetical protein
MKKLLSTLFALAFALNCYAADVKISDLTEVTSPTTSTAASLMSMLPFEILYNGKVIATVINKEDSQKIVSFMAPS